MKYLCLVYLSSEKWSAAPDSACAAYGQKIKDSGHFITGAWTLVMIYDYHHGRDFADEGLELERPMFAEFTPLLTP